jgi:O-antigen/teichoic acid export membrane protein
VSGQAFSERAKAQLADRRLVRGVGANIYGQASTLLIQVVSVPLMLVALGGQTYGLWLVISAIPSYLALADFGFSSSAANDMTLAVARGAHAQARIAFQSVLALNLAVAAAVVAVAASVIALAPGALLPQTPAVDASQVRLALLLQTCQIAATLSCGAFTGGFLSSGRYSLAVVLSSSARLLENAALVAGALLFHNLALAAAMMLATRFVALVATAVALSRAAPWLTIGWRDARLSEIRRLAAPAVAVTALPAAFAISLQGVVLVIGATLSLDAVATFSATRTLTRAVIQLGNVVNSAIMPEVTRAFGARDGRRLRRLVRLNLAAVGTLNAIALAAIAAFGPALVAVWTRGRIAPDALLVIGLAMVAALHSLWLSQANLLLSINRHAQYAYWFLAVSLASVLAAAPCARLMGVNGLVAPLLLAECAMIPIAARAFRSTFADAAAIGEARPT